MTCRELNAEVLVGREEEASQPSAPEVEMLPGPLQNFRFTVRPGEVSWVDVTLDPRCRHIVRCELPVNSTAVSIQLQRP